MYLGYFLIKRFENGSREALLSYWGKIAKVCSSPQSVLINLLGVLCCSGDLVTRQHLALLQKDKQSSRPACSVPVFLFRLWYPLEHQSWKWGC